MTRFRICVNPESRDTPRVPAHEEKHFGFCPCVACPSLHELCNSPSSKPGKSEVLFQKNTDNFAAAIFRSHFLPFNAAFFGHSRH